MSIHTEDLRGIAANHGWLVCAEAADEIEDLENAYELLFAENAKLRALVSPGAATRDVAPEDVARARRIASEAQPFIDDRSYVGRGMYINDLVWALGVLAAPQPVTQEMINRFLNWPLPKGFSPDCGISFDGRKDDEWNKNKTWPIGTNLLSADQARAMLEHVLAASAEQAVPRAEPAKRMGDYKRLVSQTIGYEWGPGELQTVNADDLLRLIDALAWPNKTPQGDDIGLVRKDEAEVAIKALQDRIARLDSSLECEKRMRKDAEEDQERYRHVRTLSPRAFTEIHMRNIDGEGLFDDLIDQDMEMRAEAIRATFPKEAT